MNRQICAGMFVLVVWIPIEMIAAPRSAARQSVNNTAPGTCPVTLPRRHLAPIDAMSFFEPGTSSWKPTLSVGLYPDGTVVFRPGGPGSTEADGFLGMNFWWTRGEGLRGKLKIHGKRLDAPAPPLRAEIPEGYGETGFQATALIFSSEGCWQVTGEVGDTHLTFVPSN